jgi:hypothetical protein
VQDPDPSRAPDVHLRQLTEALRRPDLGDTLQRLVALAVVTIPEAAAACVTTLRDGLPTSPATTGSLAAALDPVQYATSGPCVETARTGQVLAMRQAREETGP